MMNKSRAALEPGPSSTFTPRVTAVLLILLFIFLGWTFFWMLYDEWQTLLASKQDALDDQVSLAISICNQRAAAVADGREDLEQSQAEALTMLRGLRYGPMNTGSFFVLSLDGCLLANPLRPDLEGKSLYKITDRQGERFVTEMTKNARDNIYGHIRYDWDWSETGTEGVSRLASYTLFEPWGWVIATDITTADIDEQITHELTQQVGVLLLLTVALAIVLSVTLRRLVLSGVDRLIILTRRLQRGDFTARASISPTDELRPLAAAINEMAEGIEKRDEQVRLAQRTAVFALAKLAEARDNETGGHLLRVREYALVLARALRSDPRYSVQMGNGYLADLYDATMLHDIGKVGIPDGILLKPDTLDEGEMAIMMSHTLIGANTIRAARQQMDVDSSFLRMAEKITRSHHERWDGTGYIEQLKGDQIPLAARIFTIADVYDALTTARPYKQAYSHEQAIATMSEERGRQFDPALFDVFLRVQEDFNRIRREFTEA